MKERLKFIYEGTDIEPLWEVLQERISQVKSKKMKKRKQNWDEKDVVLITYGDQFHKKGQPTLKTFKRMFEKHLIDKFGIVHLLPFYPYSSDDGFSVIDYKSVNPIIGEWENVNELSESTRIMFDYVCNHVSAKSDWFNKYLQNDPDYADFFIDMNPTVDLSGVTRPRASPLLTKFTSVDGKEKNIWTTFSEDQPDLNFANPQVLIKMMDVLLFYLEQGAEYVRLDAVGFMWKESGTSCIHLEKTHELVKLMREVVEEVAPGTVIITETNVPHKDNVSYFGNGDDEAHMVYQFPLPPLVLHALHNGNSSVISKWAKELELPTKETTFFNFLASHDGIGINPVRGIIPEEEILTLVDDLKEEGALVSYKKNPDGTESPYEMNVTYLDALNKKMDNDDLRLARFLVGHSILLTFPGVPAVYVQSVLGSRNDMDGVKETGRNRSINRQKYELEEIEEQLADTSSLRRKVFDKMTDIIKIRKEEPLFHPNSSMKVIDVNEKIFAFKRYNEKDECIYIIHNITNEEISFEINTSSEFVDLVTNLSFFGSAPNILKPYQFVWLKKK